jgi:hypothetical protein
MKPPLSVHRLDEPARLSLETKPLASFALIRFAPMQYPSVDLLDDDRAFHIRVY